MISDQNYDIINRATIQYISGDIIVNKLFPFIIILLVFNIFCTSDNVSSGGTDVANSYANIQCVDSLGNKLKGVNVTLTGVLITESGDSSFYSESQRTNNYGIVNFKEIPEGNYAITAIDSEVDLGAIISKLTVYKDSTIINKLMTLKHRAPLKGRIANINDFSNISIIIPGIKGSIQPDVQGFYYIDNMFVGEYDICYISNNSINYLNISVSKEVSDTVYIRDINFSESINDKSISYDFYSKTLTKSYQIEPQYYAPQQEPLWYEDHDFSIVEYIKDEDDPKYIWRYPILVGISDTTLKYYGNDSSVMVTLIKDQLDKVSANFNSADIGGIIEFAIDSVYFFVGDVQLEKNPVSDKFSVRLLYEAFKDSSENFASWIANSRVLTYAYSASDSGGVFGERGLRFLTALFGWSRGAYYLEHVEVSSANNEVNGESFKLPDYVMTIRDYSNWSATNSMVINYTGSEMRPSSDIATDRFPDSISLYFTDSQLSSIDNVMVDIYSKDYATSIVKDSVLYSGTAGADGVFNFTNNPFVNIDSTVICHNLLIRSINGNDTAYTWFPMYEVIDSCFIEVPTNYTKKIILP